MQQLRIKSHAGTLETLDPDRIDTAAASGWMWLDITDPSPGEILDLAGRFAIPKPLIEDLLEPTLFPKLDVIGDHLLVVLHAIDARDDEVDTIEVDAVLGPGILLTFHHGVVPGLDWLAAEAAEVPALAEGGLDRFLARLAEISARRFLPLLEDLETRLEDLEDLAIAGHPEIPAVVQVLRRQTIEIRRMLAPQRDVMLTLARDEATMISERARHRFSDAHDLLHRTVETLDGDRIQLGGILETYRGTVAEKMNEVMKVLSVFSVILLPLSLIAGIYGMNFAHMPELGWRWGYFALLGVMAAVAAGLWVYFVRRGFIGGPRLSRLPGTVVRGLGRSVAGAGQLVSAPMRLMAGAIGSRGAPDAQDDRSARPGP